MCKLSTTNINTTFIYFSSPLNSHNLPSRYTGTKSESYFVKDIKALKLTLFDYSVRLEWRPRLTDSLPDSITPSWRVLRFRTPPATYMSVTQWLLYITAMSQPLPDSITPSWRVLRFRTPPATYMSVTQWLLYITAVWLTHYLTRSHLVGEY